NTTFSNYSHLQYEWDFGDSTQSTQENASSKGYTIPGLYTIRLIAKDSGGADTFCRQFSAFDLPVAHLSGDTSTCTLDCLVLRNFSNNSNTFNFDFGDNTTLTTNDTGIVKKMYAAFGKFTIRLIVGTGSGCSDTAFHEVNIKPGAKAD